MLKQLKIPVGVSDFRKIRENGYYYMDKSGLIVPDVSGKLWE